MHFSDPHSSSSNSTAIPAAPIDLGLNQHSAQSATDGFSSRLESANSSLTFCRCTFRCTFRLRFHWLRRRYKKQHEPTGVDVDGLFSVVVNPEYVRTPLQYSCHERQIVPFLRSRSLIFFRRTVHTEKKIVIVVVVDSVYEWPSSLEIKLMDFPPESLLKKYIHNCTLITRETKLKFHANTL